MSRFTRLARALLSSKWVKPSLREEWGEILRTAKQFDMDPDILKKAYKRGRLVLLNDSIWRRLENTDSWEIELGDWDTIKHLVRERRNLSQIREGIEEGSSMPAPMVLSIHGIYYLIGGNTRLMVSRAMGVRPEILLITVGHEIH